MVLSIIKAHSEPNQLSKMVLFAKIVNDLKLLTVSRKRLHLKYLTVF